MRRLLDSAQVQHTLERVFGHDSLRAGQHEIIQSVLEDGATLAVMPTGSGKSLCYQLPAVLLPGLTVVVSPLIALIRDQVQALSARGVRAASFTSADSQEDRARTERALREGSLDLLYVAPERFRSGWFLERLRAAQLDLLVVDEAHCISEWGHDFRPDYAKLAEVLRALAPPRVAAFTATATPEVQSDIVRGLGLASARTIITGFDRENLELSVLETGRGKAKKLKATARALETWMKKGGSGLVYVATRKTAEEVAGQLAELGFKAEPYHAGLPPERRQKVQDRFQRRDGRVIVATTAFGMGVDKRDVRVVVHYHVPSSVESYYQEVGRAGRDDQPAGGVLLYDTGDLRYALLRLEASCPTPAIAAATHRYALRAAEQGAGLGFDDLCLAAEENIAPSARAAVIALERCGDLSFEGGVLSVRPEMSLSPAMLEARTRRERARLDALIGYVSRAACRRRYVVEYFGDRRHADRCGVCDRCQAPEAKPLEGEAFREAQMALSCVARMRGRYGRSRVVEVLLGSRAVGVLTAGLDQLSTYGLLKHRSREHTLDLLDRLVRAELAAVTPGEFPKLLLTERGADTLRQRSPILLGGASPGAAAAKSSARRSRGRGAQGRMRRRSS